ncbi:MAG: HAD family phosphatase [Thermoleophilia bacterium]
MRDDLPSAVRGLIMDVDGTLVDNVYLHTRAWDLAFRDVGMDSPGWVLHRHVGMGGDRLVSGVAGDAAEREHGDRLRWPHDRRFAGMLHQVRPLPGAHGFITSMAAAGVRGVPAGSGTRPEMDHFARLPGVGDVLHAVVTSEDVDASKPSLDLVRTAAQRLGHEPARARLRARLRAMRSSPREAGS